MDIVAAAIGAASLGTAAVLLTATLRIGGAAATVAAALVIGASIVVATCIALSLVHAMTGAALLVAALLIAAVAAGAWHAQGRPRPGIARPAAVVAAVRGDPATALLIVVAAAACCFQAFMAVAIAPNEFDALLYHLPRAAYWVQAHSALQFAPGLPGDPRVVSPPNAELLAAWSMALSHSDRFVQLVQWLALVGLGATVFVGARLLRFGHRTALFAAALTVVLPDFVLQAATPQNDLAVTFFVAATAVFAIRGLRDRARGDLAVAALAAGLAVGTKGTALLAAPSLALLVLAAAWRYRPRRGILIGGACMLAAALVVLGSFNYIQNVANHGSITGGAESTVAQDFAKENLSSGLPATVAQITWNFVDAPGLPDSPPLKAALRDVAGLFFPGAHRDHPPPIKTDVLPDETAFGPVGLLLFLPLLAWTLLWPRSPGPRRLVAASAVLYLVIFAAAFGYSAEAGRLIMPMVAIGAPLFASLHRPVVLRWLAVVLAVAGLAPTLVLDQYKPLLLAGEDSIFVSDHLDQQLIDVDLTDHGDSIRRLDLILPPNAPLGFVIDTDPTLRALDYALFGPHFGRHVTPVEPGQIARALGGGRIAGLVVWRRRPGLALPPNARIDKLGAGSILVRGPAR